MVCTHDIQAYIYLQTFTHGCVSFNALLSSFCTLTPDLDFEEIYSWHFWKEVTVVEEKYSAFWSFCYFIPLPQVMEGY